MLYMSLPQRCGKTCIVVSLLWLSLCPISTFAADRDVSVYYYPWYDQPNNGHWLEGCLRTRLIPPSPPKLGLYDSRDTRVIQAHLNWSEDFGIDNWICSWWGPNSFEDITIRQHILPEIKGKSTKFCIYYESSGLLGMNKREEIVFDDRAIEKMESDIRYLCKTYFRHPNYQYVEGRPILHFYLSRCFAGRYAEGIEAARKAARRQGLELLIVGDEIFWGSPNAERIGMMDAITAYCMHGPPDFAGYPADSEFLRHLTFKFDEHARVAEQHGVRLIPNVFPGYNNRGRGGTVYAIPRQYERGGSETSTFRKMANWAEEYIDPDLNAVCITSFNEWHEDTQIEPTVVTPATSEDDTGSERLTSGYLYQGYGESHLQLVRELFGSAQQSAASP